MRIARGLALLVLPVVIACGSSGSGTPPVKPPSADSGPSATPTLLVFDTAADLHSPDHFFDMPFPSDGRLSASGAPDLAGLANPDMSAVFEGLRGIAMDRKGFPVTPVAYFRFTAAMPALDPAALIPAVKASPILLLDVDPKSSSVGALVPTVAAGLASDAYLPEGMLAVAPRPGFVLEPAHQYAFVVRTALGDATGAPLGVSPSFAAVDSSAAAALYAPLWRALAVAGIARTEIAAATVFTTGDVVKDTFDLSTKVLGAYTSDIQSVTLDAQGATYDGFCSLHAQVTYPQFQGGTPPYDTGGLFQIGADGLPVKMSDATVRVTLTIPRAPMPAGGWPIVVYFHGTGGVADAIINRGPWVPMSDTSACNPLNVDSWMGQAGCYTPGKGPGYVVAGHGIAMIASALPVDPQRYPAGFNQPLPEYINLNNVAATRDIFRQGIVEQRLFIDAVTRLTIPQATLASCPGVTLPAGETAFHFKTDRLGVQGQSMGAMYANLISAVEPRAKVVVATGAGGYWSWFILQSSFVDNIKGKIGLLLDVRGDFSFLHPTMSVIQAGLEPADPIVYMPRVAHEPLAGHPVRPVYQPVGQGDSYFPTPVQDAVAVAYRNQEAGSVVWTTMQDALTLEGLQGLVPYPVAQNLTAADGTKYTGAVVQYTGDGVYDPHAISEQLDSVKYQYGCFLETFVGFGVATLPAPMSIGTPCPH